MACGPAARPEKHSGLVMLARFLAVVDKGSVSRLGFTSGNRALSEYRHQRPVSLTLGGRTVFCVFGSR